MKHPNQLIHGLRLLFGTLRIVMLFNLVIGSPFLLLLYSRHDLAAARVRFSDDSATVRVMRDSLNSDRLTVTKLEGTLTMKDSPAGSQMRSHFPRWARLPSMLVAYAFLLLVIHLLWRLCRNAERGDVFSEGNVRLVRALGGLLIVFSVLTFLSNLWAAYQIGNYVEDHVSIEGIKAITLWARPEDFIGPAVGRFVTGLLVLAMAEVFRQGLTLKQDTDLTI